MLFDDERSAQGLIQILKISFLRLTCLLKDKFKIFSFQKTKFKTFICLSLQLQSSETLLDLCGRCVWPRSVIFTIHEMRSAEHESIFVPHNKTLCFSISREELNTDVPLYFFWTSSALFTFIRAHIYTKCLIWCQWEKNDFSLSALSSPAVPAIAVAGGEKQR